MLNTNNKELLFIHDYLCQKGGAERVVQAMTSVSSLSPLYTFAYNPQSTYESFSKINIKVPKITNYFAQNEMLLALSILLKHSSIKLPPSDLSIFSSSGWSHLIQPQGPSLVYFHTPARWLYSSEQIIEDRFILKIMGNVGKNALVNIDRKGVSRHKCIVANSKVSQKRILHAYNRNVPIVNPPLYIENVPLQSINSIQNNFILHVGRDRSYKNYRFMIEIAKCLPNFLFVLVGISGNHEIPKNCLALKNISDGELHWLYSNAQLLIAVAEEDYGLTPLEAAFFGTPTLALSVGGYLETIVDGSTGWLLPERNVNKFTEAIRFHFDKSGIDAEFLKKHAEQNSPKSFLSKLIEIGFNENN